VRYEYKIEASCIDVFGDWWKKRESIKDNEITGIYFNILDVQGIKPDKPVYNMYNFKEIK